MTSPPAAQTCDVREAPPVRDRLGLHAAPREVHDVLPVVSRNASVKYSLRRRRRSTLMLSKIQVSKYGASTCAAAAWRPSAALRRRAAMTISTMTVTGGTDTDVRWIPLRIQPPRRPSASSRSNATAEVYRIAQLLGSPNHHVDHRTSFPGPARRSTTLPSGSTWHLPRMGHRAGTRRRDHLLVADDEQRNLNFVRRGSKPRG